MKFLAGSEKRFVEFISGLNEKDRVGIISHCDNDGMASALIVAKVVGNPEIVKFVDYSSDMFQKNVDEFKNKKINKVVITDVYAETDEAGLKQIGKFAEVLIIDHHVFSKDLNSDKTIFLNGGYKLPASYLCYSLFSNFQGIPGWIPALGIVADRPDLYNEGNADNVFMDFKIGEKVEGIWDYTIILGRAMIYFRDVGELNKIYDLLVKAKGEGDINQLREYSDAVKKEMDSWLDKYEKEKEEHGDLVLFEINPKYSIKGILINIISTMSEAENKTFVFLNEKEDGKVTISARCQSKKRDCVKLLANALKGIPDSNSGGHVPAAGGSFPAKYLGQFKKQLFEALG